MCNTRNDIISPGTTFWAYDKFTGKCADQSGHCICTYEVPWAIHAVDSCGCERVFLRHLFRFEELLRGNNDLNNEED
jgi:hypothetical protein